MFLKLQKWNKMSKYWVGVIKWNRIANKQQHFVLKSQGLGNTLEWYSNLVLQILSFMVFGTIFTFSESLKSEDIVICTSSIT